MASITISLNDINSLLSPGGTGMPQNQIQMLALILKALEEGIPFFVTHDGKKYRLEGNLLVEVQ